MPHTKQSQQVSRLRKLMSSAQDRLKAARQSGESPAKIKQRRAQLNTAKDKLRQLRRGSGSILKNDPNFAKDTAARAANKPKLVSRKFPRFDPAGEKARAATKTSRRRASQGTKRRTATGSNARNLAAPVRGGTKARPRRGAIKRNARDRPFLESRTRRGGTVRRGAGPSGAAAQRSRALANRRRVSAQNRARRNRSRTRRL